MSTQTVFEIYEVSNVKEEECDSNVEEKHIAVPCKYFLTIKGYRRGVKLWFSHDKNQKPGKKD